MSLLFAVTNNEMIHKFPRVISSVGNTINKYCENHTNIQICNGYPQYWLLYEGHGLHYISKVISKLIL